MKFKIGDRVKPKNYSGRSCGTIILIEDDRHGVKHDEYEYTHCLGGNCPDGYGWYYYSYELELISSSTDILILLL